MKYLTRFIIISTLLFTSVTTFSQMDLIKSGLPVVGFVTQEGKKCGDAQVSIYEGNNLVNRFFTPKNGKFQLLMHLDKYYTLEVSKQGYIQKRIAFNTKMLDTRVALPVYELDLDLTPTYVMGGQDMGDLDFPMALVSYHSKNKKFQHNEEYTSHMRTTYDSILKMAFEVNVSK